MDRGRKGPAPDTRERPQRRGFRGTSENAKTKICLRWQSGQCRFGDRCNFAHGDTELRQPPARPPIGRGRGRGDSMGDEGGPGRGAGRGQGPRGSDESSDPRTSNGDRNAWVASGCPVKGAAGWTQYQTESGEKYYHNGNTNVTQWETPADWTGPA